MSVKKVSSIPKDLRAILLEELLKNPFLGINITDGEGRVLYLNEAHGRITGHDPSLYIGRTMNEIFLDGLISESATQLVLDTKESAFINQVTSKKNKHFQVKAIPVMDDDNEIKYVVNYLLEVSELIELQDKLEKAVDDKLKLANSNELLWKRLNVLGGDVVFRSKKMEKIVEYAERIAERDVTVLITGPSGAGKEMVANLIHASGERKNGPFVKINCAAIPEHLLESELFGYEAGAFTGGSKKGKKGLIESAHLGTLLLDEIGELPLPLQSKLLRVLQTHTVRHIGATKDIPVDFRVIASTNANLKQMIEEKTFREDLYYRLNVINIAIPGLEERPEDIIPLAEHFLEINNKKYKTEKTFRNDALKFLAECNYPGNIRELRNVIERAVIMSQGNIITLSDAVFAYGDLVSEQNFPESVIEENVIMPVEGSLKEIVEEYEKKLLQQYMSKYKNKTKVAELLQTDQSTISRKCKKYHICCGR